MFHPPRSKTTCRRTYKTCSHIVLVQMKTILKGLKIGQRLNKSPKVRINLIFITNTLIRRTIIFTVLRMWFLGHRHRLCEECNCYLSNIDSFLNANPGPVQMLFSQLRSFQDSSHFLSSKSVVLHASKIVTGFYILIEKFGRLNPESESGFGPDSDLKCRR